MIGTIFKIGMGIAKSAIKGAKGEAEVKKGKQEVEITKITAKTDRLRILSKVDNIFEAFIKIPIAILCIFLLLDRYFVLRSTMSDDLSIFFLTFSTMILGGIYSIKKWQQPKVEQLRKENEEQKLKRIEKIAQTNFSHTFTLKELVASNTADKEGIDNTTTDPTIIANLQHISTQVIDKIKARFAADTNMDMPFLCTSGYRCEELNRIVGGVTDSQHTKGEAIDIILPQHSRQLKPLFKYICLTCDDLPIDQIIYEHRGENRWIHISSTRSENRFDMKTMKNGKYKKYDPKG